MAIKMKFNNVIKAFNQLVRVDTYGSGYNDEGIYTETFLKTKHIKAIILMLSMEQLQLLQQGESSDAGIGIISKVPLNFSDNRYANSNIIQKQDYVDYGGYRYRVVGTGIMEFNTNCYCYTALRYLK